MRLLSSVVPELRSELEHVVARPRRQQRQDVAQVRPWLDVMEFAAGDEAGGDGVPFCAVVAAAERPIGSAHHRSHLILPMSRFVLAFAIAGTRILIVI